MVAQTTFKELWPDKIFTASKVKLCSYSGELIPVLGVKVDYKGQIETLPKIGTGPSLLGCDWLLAFKLDWHERK